MMCFILALLKLLWLNAADTLIRDNPYQLLECRHESKTQLQTVPERP